MWDRYPGVAAELVKVEAIIENNLRSKNKPLEQLLKTLSNAGGKRLRPAFVDLSAGFGKTRDHNLLTAAAGIEIIHMATLVHDDIIDDAEIRRGKPTINRLYGDKMAVYLGDFLLTRAVLLLSQAVPEDRLEQIARGIKSICEAEVEQFYSRFNAEVSLVTYLKRIGRKTAGMFSSSCAEGAFLSKTPRKFVRNLVKFGFYYGMAFQMQDDILNLTQDIQITGKPKGNDIQEGVITLPLILALRKSQQFRHQVKNMLTGKKPEQKEIKWTIQEIVRLGGIDEARAWVDRYVQRALSMLAPLPNKPEKNILTELAIGLNNQ